MRMILRTTLFGLVLVTAAARGLAAQGGVRVTPQGVRVDFQDADLRLVIAALAEAGNLNVVYGDLPARRVTLRMQQPVPTESLLPLLRSLAASNGLRVSEEGGFLRLETAAAGGAPTDTASAPPPTESRLYVYRLKHVRSVRLAATLQSIFGGGRGGSPAPAGPRAPTLREGLEGQRVPPRDTDRAAPAPAPQVNVEVGPVRSNLPGQLVGEVQIVPDEASNSLLVRAQPADWNVVRGAIEALDLRPLQVLIEVLIAEVRRTSDFDLELSGSVSSKEGATTITGKRTGTVTDGNFVLGLLRSGGLDLDAALSVLKSRGNVRILSRPVILAQNNQEARILIGAQRPFVQVSRSLPTDQGVRDQVVQYRDVGTKLTITPTINEDGYVNLEVLQEVSTATAEVQFGAPVISTREAATHLFVRTGQTAVLGGLIDHQEESSRSGIPLLMEIPILGHLFGSTRTSTVNNELFLFLTPHIITTDSDADWIRDGVEQGSGLLKGDTPLQRTLFPAETTAVPSPEAGPR